MFLASHMKESLRSVFTGHYNFLPLTLLSVITERGGCASVLLLLFNLQTVKESLSDSVV